MGFKKKLFVTHTIFLFLFVLKWEEKKSPNSLILWTQENIDENGSYLERKNFKSGYAVLSRKKIQNISGHFTEPRLKELAKDIHVIIQKAQFMAEAPLNPESHNHAKKVQQGVTGFTYYKLFHKGMNLRLNCEKIKGKEYPYSLNIIIKK